MGKFLCQNGGICMGIPGMFKSVANWALSENRDYQKLKKLIRDRADTMHMYSVAGLISVVVVEYIGIRAISSGSLYRGFGVLFINSFIFYWSYNHYQVSENLQTVADNPIRYIKFSDDNFDKEAYREVLSRRTIFFDWKIDQWVEGA